MSKVEDQVKSWLQTMSRKYFFEYKTFYVDNGWAPNGLYVTDPKMKGISFKLYFNELGPMFFEIDGYDCFPYNAAEEGVEYVKNLSNPF